MLINFEKAMEREREIERDRERERDNYIFIKPTTSTG